MVTHWPAPRTDATTWFHCPDSPRMQRAPPQRLVRGRAGMCAGIASRAGGVEVVTVGGGPHGCGELRLIVVGQVVRQQPSPNQPAQPRNVVSQPRLPEDAARPPQRPLRGRESQVASHGRRARHRGNLLPQLGGAHLSPQTPHSATTWFHCPDTREMQRGRHNGLSGPGRVCVRAGGDTHITAISRI